MQRSIAPIMLSVALLLGAACGESDDQATSSPSTATPAAATSPTATAATASALKLVPAIGTALGSPAVPPPSASTATSPAPLANVLAPYRQFGTDAKPDLILSSKLRHEKIYAQLSAIAPTIMSDRPGVTFRENFALYSQAVGKEQQAADVVARYEARVKAVSAALATPRPSVSIVQVRSNVLRFYQRSNFLGTILTDLGLPRSKAQNVDDFSADLGLESIGEYADGDVIILALQGGEQNPLWKELQALPLWRNLPAVKDNKVITVDDQTWIGGVGYGAASLALDGIEKSLGK